MNKHKLYLFLFTTLIINTFITKKRKVFVRTRIAADIKSYKKNNRNDIHYKNR